MKKILFIGYSLHLKTRSSDFMIDLLKEHFQVDTLFFHHAESEASIREKLPADFYDAVVVWMIPFGLKIAEQLHCRRRFFFPMYDWLPSMEELSYARNFTFFCFCRLLQKYYTQLNFRAVFVQYAPPVITREIPSGNPRSMFFWKRRDFPAEKEVMKLHSGYPLEHLYVHDAPDHMSTPAKMELLQGITKIERGQWFERKEDMFRKMEESALYFAPRAEEGIGMGFLNAMAHNRCVIAPNNPTMNEYIVHGQTGILYDPRNPVFDFSTEDVLQIQANLPAAMKQLAHQWQADQEKIVRIIDEESSADAGKKPCHFSLTPGCQTVCISVKSGR